MIKKEHEIEQLTHLRMAVLREKTEAHIDRLLGIYLCYCKQGLMTDQEMINWRSGEQKKKSDQEFLVQMPIYHDKSIRPIEWIVCFVSLNHEQRTLIEDGMVSTQEMKVFGLDSLHYFGLEDIYCKLVDSLGGRGYGRLHIPSGVKESFTYLSLLRIKH